MGDEKSLAHTRWNCKYHIVFAPKYRRQAFYGEKRRAVGSILRKLCEWKNVRILEAISTTNQSTFLPLKQLATRINPALVIPATNKLTP
ncbi:transposase for insertion sequence element IS200 [Salmonella enterica subsp. enterica serovar Typhi]|nr:transposase for insertion sequence element IS200 [Salmonella enterica subsp. enterica serovar Typhi]CGR33794.1 transposase for insertion sequence element IS200 [Salmonella enterica subsp. enterica serovar Typhi]CHV14342.1 transposase for insertion sequence element IS200 [Salmonella enterica subsp. enterica serovar Typhi]